MSKNKLALIRFKTIDQCLRRSNRKWTLENLVDAVSDALYEYEGIDSGVSVRTVQSDIQNMRSDKLGYNAPIIVTEKKFYSYEDKNYSITNTNVSAQDLEKLNDVVRILKQFKGFTYFEDLSEMVGKLELKIVKQKNEKRTFISFEKNELLRGLSWIDPLLTAIKNEQVLDIFYQSFKAKTASTIKAHPYLLKEYRNRWFLLCRNSRMKTLNILALDRIEKVENNSDLPFVEATGFDVETFFDDCIGVTKTLNQKPQKVILKALKRTAPYIITKPLHESQTILKEDETGMIFSLDVIVNFELEREILGFGEAIQVLSPRFLKHVLLKRMELMLKQYEKANPF